MRTKGKFPLQLQCYIHCVKGLEAAYLLNDRPEDTLIAFVIDAVSQGKVDGVVLSLTHTCSYRVGRTR